FGAQKPHLRSRASSYSLGKVLVGSLPVLNQQLRAAQFLKGERILRRVFQRLNEIACRVCRLAPPALHHSQSQQGLGASRAWVRRDLVDCLHEVPVGAIPISRVELGERQHSAARHAGGIATDRLGEERQGSVWTVPFQELLHTAR